MYCRILYLVCFLIAVPAFRMRYLVRSYFVLRKMSHDSVIASIFESAGEDLDVMRI